MHEAQGVRQPVHGGSQPPTSGGPMGRVWIAGGSATVKSEFSWAGGCPRASPPRARDRRTITRALQGNLAEADLASLERLASLADSVAARQSRLSAAIWGARPPRRLVLGGRVGVDGARRLDHRGCGGRRRACESPARPSSTEDGHFTFGQLSENLGQSSLRFRTESTCSVRGERGGARQRHVGGSK